MKVRILSFFLTLCMVLSVFPAVVFATEAGDVVVEADDTKTLASLLADATTKSVKLTKDETIVTTVSKDVTIDLNGFELAGTIMVNGNVTIVDNSGKESGGFKADVVKGTGSLVIKNAYFVENDVLAYVATTSVIEGNKVRLAAVEEIPYEVNGVKYVRWADAVAAGKDIAVIQNVALKDVVTESVNVSVAAGKVLDLGNLVVDGGNTLTIVTGEVKATSVTGHIDLVNVTMHQTADPFTGADVEIEGGYYAFNVASYLTADYKQVNGRVVGWKSDYVAYVGTTGYTATELANLLKNANNAHVILVADVERTLTIAANSSTTIELNGYSINSTVYNYGNNVIITNTLNSGVTHTINLLINEGTVALRGGFIADVENYGKVVVDGAELGSLENYSTVEESFKMASGIVAKSIGDVYYAREYFIDNAGIKFDAVKNEYNIIKYVAFVGDKGCETVEEARTDIAAVTGTAVVTLWADLDTVTVNGDVEFVIKAGKLTNVTVAAGATLKTKDVNGTLYTYGGPKTYAEIKTPICYIVVDGENVYYTSIQDAIDSITVGQATTIYLMGSCEGAGAVIPAGVIVTIDLRESTYTFNMGVGSTGTESNGFQILKGSTVTIQNGNLNVAESAASTFYTIIQNYSDLTITDVNLDGKNLDKWSKTDGDSYVVSNNSGTVLITGKTSITANDDGNKAFAFDVCKYGSYDAPNVTIDTEGTIIGKIEVSDEVTLSIVNGTFEGASYADLYPYIDAENSQLKPTEKGYGVAEGVATYVAQIGTVKYIDLATALADAANSTGKVTVTLLADAKDVVIPAGTATSIIIKGGAFVIENITKNNTGTLSISTGTVKGAIVVNAGTFSISGKTAYYVTELVDADGAESKAKITITGGKWYGIEASDILPYVGTTKYVVVEAEDDTGAHLTVKAVKPQASVVDAETKEELFRYGVLQDAIAAAIAWDGNVYVEILDATATAVVDLVDDDTLVIVGDVTNITAIKDVDTYTTFETVEGTTTYTGHETLAIAEVAGDKYYYDDLAVLATLEADLVTVYVNESITLSRDVTELVLPEGYNKNITFVGTTKVGGIYYFAGAYETIGVYAASVSTSAGTTVYATLRAAVNANAVGAEYFDIANKITVNKDGDFTVRPGYIVVIDDATYSTGEYTDTSAYEATIKTTFGADKIDVRYNTVQDAIDAATDAAGTTRVTVEIVNVADDFVLSEIVVALKDNEVILNANGVKIENINVANSTKRFTVNKADLDGAQITVTGGSLTVSNTNTGTINTLTVTAVEEYAATASVSINVETATVTSIDTKAASLSVTNATVNYVTANGEESKYPATVTLSGKKDYVATIENSITINGFVKLATSNFYTRVNGITFGEVYTLSTKSIKGGDFYVTADTIAILEAAGTLYTDVEFSNEGTFYQAVNTKDIVASVNGKLYLQEQFADAVQDAITGGYELIILQQPTILVESTVSAITEWMLPSNVVIKYSVAEGVTVDFKFTAQDSAYYAFASIADGVVTVNVLQIVAKIGSTPYASIEDAIEAFTAGDVINVIVEGDVVELTAALTVKFGDKGVIFLAAGKYTLTPALYDAVEAKYEGINYLDIKLATDAYYAKGVGVVSVKADVDFEATEAITFGVAAGATLTLSGNAVVTLNGTLDATVKVTSADLKFVGDIDAVVFDIDGKANYCLKETETPGVYAIVLAEASVNGVYYETFAEAYAKKADGTIKLWNNVTFTNLTLADATVDLNGNVITVASITVTNSAVTGNVTLKNGTVKLADELESKNKKDYIIVVTKGTLTLVDMVITDVSDLYNTTFGEKATVLLKSDTTLAGNGITLTTVIVDPAATKPANLNVSGTVNIENIYCVDGLLNCAKHVDTNNDHVCDYCLEKAVPVMLTAGTVNGYTADEDGVYWIFAGDPVTLDHGKVEPGKHFVTWTVSYPSAYNKETGELVVAPKLDGTAVIVTAQIVDNANVTVQVNAPMFTVTGLNGYQVGSAIVTPNAGEEIVVTYNPLNIKELGTAIYWVNDNGAIVQTGNTITYRVPAIGGTLTAICAPAAENSTLVVFQNGASTVGTKVISYATYTADDSTIVLPAAPALGTLTVDGWAYNGKKVTDKEIKDLIGTTNVICLVPNVVANTATITVNGTEMAVDVDEYTHLTADASKDGKYFTNWTVSEEGKPDQTFDTEILTYKFKGGEVVTANYESDTLVARKPVTTVIGNYADNKLVITGLYQTPEGYTMVDAGIIYTTTDMDAADINVEAADVVVKHVTIKDLKSATYTVTLTFKSEVKNVYFRSFVTYRDLDGNEVVIYSDGRTVFTAKTGLVTTEA